MLSQRLALGFWDLGILVLHLSALLARYSGTQGLGLWFDIRLKLRTWTGFRAGTKHSCCPLISPGQNP